MEELEKVFGAFTDHLTNSLVNAVKGEGQSVLKTLSGKQVKIEINITFPDLTK